MAIEYGMSVQEFWENDPDLFWAYRFSYYNKIKNKQELVNNNSWLQGAYFYEAISVALNNAFNKDKIEYSKQPYNFKKNEQEEKAKQNDVLIAKLKGRVAQVQSIMKSNESSTTTEGNTEGGEKINE